MKLVLAAAKCAGAIGESHAATRPKATAAAAGPVAGLAGTALENSATRFGVSAPAKKASAGTAGAARSAARAASAAAPADTRIVAASEAACGSADRSVGRVRRKDTKVTTVEREMKRNWVRREPKKTRARPTSAAGTRVYGWASGESASCARPRTGSGGRAESRAAARSDTVMVRPRRCRGAGPRRGVS